MSTQTAADVTTQPAETRFAPERFGRGVKRVIEYAWPIRDTDDGKQLVVVLHCSHVTGAYVASVQNRALDGDGGFTWLPLSDVRVDRVPTKRYSQGGLVDFSDRALRTFREHAATGKYDAFLRGENV